MCFTFAGQINHFGAAQIAWAWRINAYLRLDLAGARGEHNNPVSKRDGLVNGMGHQQHRGAGRRPDIQQMLLHARARLDVERGKGFVHQ